MRLQGMGRIDNIRTNEALIETWITAIVALGYADNDVEIAAKDINKIQSQILGEFSIEDTRAFVYLVRDRFPEEIAAFIRYVELKEKYTEDAITFAVLQELQDITEMCIRDRTKHTPIRVTGENIFFWGISCNCKQPV